MASSIICDRETSSECSYSDESELDGSCLGYNDDFDMSSIPSTNTEDAYSTPRHHHHVRHGATVDQELSQSDLYLNTHAKLPPSSSGDTIDKCLTQSSPCVSSDEDILERVYQSDPSLYNFLCSLQKSQVCINTYHMNIL